MRTGLLPLFLVFMLFGPSANAQSLDNGEVLPPVARILDLAEESLENGHNAWALEGFQQLLDRELDENQTARRDFGLAKTHLALGNPDAALELLLGFLETHPQSVHYPEAVYQLGRTYLMLDEYETAIVHFNRFLESYGENQLTGNTFFWIGEAAFQLGHWDEAREFYLIVIQRYPNSFKVEAARYRLALIDIRSREEELMGLLQWSHEEHLESLSLLQRREMEYRQALQEYQQQLLNLQGTSGAGLSSADAGGSSGQQENLLAIKERVLAVQEYYNNLMYRELLQ